jgi:hypothetical protein
MSTLRMYALCKLHKKKQKIIVPFVFDKQSFPDEKIERLASSNKT